ncbi:MAG: alpha/beta fold hydrolase [Parcubacteria group bacterium]
MKIYKSLSIIFLILAFIFSPLSFSNIHLLTQAADIEEIIGYQEWTQDKIISNQINVNSGSTLVIRNGVTITFDNGSMNVDGKMIVSGTVKNPITFKKTATGKNYTISTRGELVMRNADVSGAGSEVFMVKNDSLVNIARAAFLGGITVRGGLLDIQGSSFHDNVSAINIISGNVRVNRTRFFNNQNDVARGSTSSDFRYNWWGNPEGPARTCYGASCYYDKIDKRINFSNWLTQENFRDPVLIIPGIMGTMEFLNKKTLDPIFKTYDGLYKTFTENGYVPNENIFTFPYEWRDSNIQNATLLRDRISEIKQITNWPKIDVVAHSMGGLLAREYVEASYYQNDIDQLVTLGTPHNGSPEDYLAWEGGKISTGPTDIFDRIAEKAFSLEAYENGFTNIFDYIHNKPIKSVPELLPVYNYLFDISKNSDRSYYIGYPRNSFLESINSANKKAKLNYIEFDNIIGNLNDDNSTVKRIRIEAQSSTPGLMWEHGIPENFSSLLGDHGLEYGNGDGVVPLESARNIDADSRVEINTKHRNLPAEGAEIVYETITGTQSMSKPVLKRIGSILAFFVFSPVDIQVIAPDGRWSGKNIKGLDENEQIEGAYYTGYDTATEFLTIPDPMDGEYKILTHGTGDGEYRIEATKIYDDANNPQQADESTGVIEGVATNGHEEEVSIEVRGGEVFAGDTVPPKVTISNPRENETYRNDQTLHASYAVEDNKTAPESIILEIYWDDVKLDNADVDLALQELGQHKIMIRAIDEAGNVGSAEINFKLNTTIDAIANNVDHYQNLGLITDPKTTDFLQVKIKDIAHTLDMLAKMGGKDNGNPADNQARLLNKQIDDLSGFISNKFNASIAQPARDLLVESFKFIKY